VRELASGRSFVDVGGMWKLYGEMALTPSAIRAMLDVARFRLLEECEVQPFALDVLAEPVPGESVIPPVDFARRRGEAREAERYTGSRGEP
jgi:hypothetical protein